FLTDDQFNRNFRGSKHQQMIQSLLDKLIQRNYIVSFEFHPKTQRIAYPGLKEQFYFPFSIQFRDGDKWILQSSTSYPRERINGYHWNAEHIKMIDPAIKKAFVIYPDAMDIIETNRCLS